jgi:hypothetical protein
VESATRGEGCAIIIFKTAVFRQINKDKACSHHDALEFPDGQIVLLTTLGPGQRATVLQLPAEPQKVQEERSARDGADTDLTDAMAA